MWIETKRLYINPPQENDFEDLYALQSDPEVMCYIGTGVRNQETVRKSLENAIQHQARHGFSLGSVFEKDSSHFVGRAGLIHLGFEDEKEIEVAYALHKAYWGLGYASELVEALIKWGFKHLPISSIVALAHPANLKSCHVLTKAQLHYVKEFEQKGINNVLYQINKDQF